MKHSYNPLVRCHGVTRAIAIRPETETRGPSAISLCAVPLAPGGYLRGDLAGLVFISVYFLFFLEGGTTGASVVVAVVEGGEGGMNLGHEWQAV